MAMERTVQQEFMYLFERVGEPLYLGPRGSSNNVYYNVPMDGMDSHTKDGAEKYRKGVGVSAGMSVQVKKPSRSPDLSSISAACPRSTLFSYFVPSHREAAAQLRRILMEQRSKEDFLAMSCVCRDSSMINPRLWIYSFATACLQRPDLKEFRMPAIWEIMPDQFVGPSVVRMAQQQAVLPKEDRSRIVIPRNFTGLDSNPENRLAYFREDLGVNSHHWHWHLVYPLDAPANQRDRKGELFYWMHHDMLARYDAERLANGLGRVKRHDLSGIVPEGYFPKLYNTNSGIVWGTRQEGTRIGSVDRLSDTRFPVRLNWEDMTTWRNRISEAIDTGTIIRDNGKSSPLTIDILGDLMEASNYSPNKQFYGDFHNMGHVAIAYSHDPMYRHREESGVMGDSSTAMRDPIFYRWHKYIDEIFDRHKQTLPPYSVDELAWPGIRVTEISVQTESRNREKNILVTNWMQSDVDLARGLDFGRTNINNLGEIWAAVTHLNHEKFSYRINVQNLGRQEVTGTVRIFLAPRRSETRSRFDIVQQRHLFMAMDKFSTVLRPGDNIINRESIKSSVTIPWEQTFRDLERSIELPNAQQSICGCGWPQHLLVPRGTTDGMLFDLYVIVTDGKKDEVPKGNNSRPSCRDATSYCGLLDEKYPDAKPMGFPFDRNPRLVNNRPIPDLDAFVKDVPNSKAVQIRIVHRDITLIRSGGAPSNMPKITMGTPTGSPSGSTSGSPSGSPSRSPTSSRPSSPTIIFPSNNTEPPGRSKNGREGATSSGGGGQGNYSSQKPSRWPNRAWGGSKGRDHSPSRGRYSWPRGWGDSDE